MLGRDAAGGRGGEGEEEEHLGGPHRLGRRRGKPLAEGSGPRGLIVAGGGEREFCRGELEDVGGVGGFICGVEGRRAGMGRGRPGRERMSWVSNVTEARE